MNTDSLKKIGRSGFTLVEMMVVLGIAAVLMGMAVPAISSWMPDFRLKSAAREIGSSLLNARLRAASNSAEFRVALNTTQVPFSYQIEQGNMPTGSTAWATDSGSYGELDANVLLGLVTPVTTVGTFTLTRPNGTSSIVTGNLVVFRPNGSTTVGADFKIQLTNTKASRYEVRISSTTGRVKIDSTWTP